MTHEYERGDKVWWWSPYPPQHKDKAIFVRYDRDLPDEDAILAINIGPKHMPFRHEFRWPLRLMGPRE